MPLKVGVQLYSVRESMRKAPVRTIEEIGRIGYRYIEVCSDGRKDPGCGLGLDPQQMKKLLERTGLTVCSAHLSPLDEENIDRVLGYHTEIGTRFIAEPVRFYQKKDDVLRACEQFNQMGRRCAQAGISYLYHNHFHEFHQFDGKAIIEILIENTDPAYFNFELDSFWCMRAGKDPIEFIKQHGERIKLLHQKDFSKNPVNPCEVLSKYGGAPVSDFADLDMFYCAPGDYAEIGDGIMPIQQIIEAALNHSKAEYIILEQDYSRYCELKGIEISFNNFKKYEGVEL